VDTIERNLRRTGVGMSAHAPVLDEYRDDDGYWINLRDGFHIDGAHAIHESTKARARKRLKDVRPCACADCRAALAATGAKP
jgi:hypothetical protein